VLVLPQKPQSARAVHASQVEALEHGGWATVEQVCPSQVRPEQQSWVTPQ
jgi:hypothetical protein